ncbi:phage tail tube protein [Priestia megaterium]|uniref:phage tail tube protein n=1 Tax=Priestia megaterium TaxID=1404 RepID=UPI0023DC4259|nr:phage major tail protein, TP901-1 family [Priestia megaterium]MDF2010196.1 phage major tail protein, TP901-1 family [Priestia megaterium]
MSKVAGVDVLLKVKDSETGTLIVVGGQTGASMSRSASTIDTSDKTTGGWSSSMVGLKSFEISAEGFVSLGDAGQELMEDSFDNREMVYVDITVGEGDDAIQYTGGVYITSLENEFAQDDAVTFSVTLSGATPLERNKPSVG